MLVAEVRALERLLAKRLDLEVARVEVGGIRYVAFSARPQKVARELRKVKSDKAPIYFVGGGRVDWRSRVPFRVVFREPPMAGGREVAFQSEREGRLHRLSLDVGGFGTPKTLDYDIYFDGSTVPHEPSIIIDPNFLDRKPE